MFERTITILGSLAPLRRPLRSTSAVAEMAADPSRSNETARRAPIEDGPSETGGFLNEIQSQLAELRADVERVTQAAERTDEALSRQAAEHRRLDAEINRQRRILQSLLETPTRRRSQARFRSPFAP